MFPLLAMTLPSHAVFCLLCTLLGYVLYNMMCISASPATRLSSRQTTLSGRGTSRMAKGPWRAQVLQCVLQTPLLRQVRCRNGSMPFGTFSIARRRCASLKTLSMLTTLTTIVSHVSRCEIDGVTDTQMNQHDPQATDGCQVIAACPWGASILQL